jgi:hypothetical protein
MRIIRIALFVVALGAFSTPASSAPILVDFESFGDFEDLASQFAADGIQFTGGTALLSGVLGGSLNDFEYPPVSGFAVAYDLTGPIRIDFATGALIASGYFTYNSPVTMTAFSGAAVVGSVTSQFAENYSGINPANELLQLSIAGGMTHLVLSGAIAGGSFTLDDFFAETRDIVVSDPIPEPGTMGLLLLGGAMLGGRRKWRSARARKGDSHRFASFRVYPKP